MKEYYDGMRVWGAVISAGASSIAFMVALFVYAHTIAEVRNETAADTIFEWSRKQPVNTGPCLELMAKFGSEDWAGIAARREVPLPTLKDEVHACLSDHDPNDFSRKVFDDTTSTLKPYDRR